LKYHPVSLRIVSFIMASFLFRFLALSAIILQTGGAATYTRPKDSKELFHLEKIPLQITSMKEISKQLVILASREHDETAIQQRANAQLLALAMRLDPMNQDARETDQALGKGNSLETAEKKEILRAKSKIRFYKKWLASEDAGSDANLLAGYLTDATKIFQPETLHNKDVANWSGVLPPLVQDPDSRKIPTDDTDESMVDTSDQPDTDNKDNKKLPLDPTSNVQFHIAALSIKAPFTTETLQKYRDPELNNIEKTRTITRQDITAVNVKIIPNKKEGASVTIIFSPHLPYQKDAIKRKLITDKITVPVIELLKAKHKNLPPSTITVTIKNGTYTSSNHQAITGPIALALESSLQNKPLRPDVHLCATIDSDGKIVQPKNFWKLIQILRKKENGGRLIVSPQSKKLLTQLLVYSEPDFFTKWEVYTAETLDQAMDVAMQSAPSDITKAHELFQSIQKLTQKSDVTKLTVNRAVRKRLFEIQDLAPNHLSSAILLIQGGGKRPMRLSEEGLAHELLPVIKRIDEILSSVSSTKIPSSSSLKKTHEELRASLDPLDRLVDRSHEDLYKETLKLTNDFRRLVAISRRIDNADYINQTALTKTATAIIFSMQGDCNTLMEQIDQIINPGKPKKP